MRAIGISVDARAVCAVVVERTTITWSQRLEIATPDAMLAALAQLVSEVPGRLRAVSVAVGAPWCQVRRIDGLPSAADVSTLTQVITENPAAYFLSGGARLAVPTVVRTEDGALWAAGFDAATIDSVVETLRERRAIAQRVLPSVCVVSRLCIPGVHAWLDGHEQVELFVGQGSTWQGARRVAVSEPFAPPPLPDGDAPADADWRFAAAFAVATADWRSQFALRPRDHLRAARIRRLRVAASGTLALVATIAAIAAPAFRADRDIDAIQRTRSRTSSVTTEAATLRRRLDSIDRALSRLATSDRQRGRATTLLAALTDALPDSCAMVSLRLDSLEATMSVLAPHAADVVAALTTLRGIDGVRLTGSVTREAIGTARLDRATIRFRIATELR